jgi:hypothetical protein
MLDVLQGNEKRLGEFIMSVNKLKAEEADLPLAAVWEAPDIEKAIAGDPKMKQKLETDLAMRLDGTPLDTVQDEKGILNGIVLRIPVPVRVMVAGKERRMVGTVIEPYRPRFTEELENRDFAEQQRLTLDTIKGYYRQAAEKVRSGALKKEDIAAALKAKISPARIQELASAPTEILSKAKIILNENFMESARVVSGAGDSEKPEFNLVMNLTDEGRRRLWQYSKLRKGSQLLFVVNGMAIAAPVVSAEIPQSDVTITNLPDGDIAKDAVETINRYAQGKGKAR